MRKIYVILSSILITSALQAVESSALFKEYSKEAELNHYIKILSEHFKGNRDEQYNFLKRAGYDEQKIQSILNVISQKEVGKEQPLADRFGALIRYLSKRPGFKGNRDEQRNFLARAGKYDNQEIEGILNAVEMEEKGVEQSLKDVGIDNIYFAKKEFIDFLSTDPKYKGNRDLQDSYLRRFRMNELQKQVIRYFISQKEQQK